MSFFDAFAQIVDGVLSSRYESEYLHCDYYINGFRRIENSRAGQQLHERKLERNYRIRHNHCNLQQRVAREGNQKIHRLPHQGTGQEREFLELAKIQLV